MLSINIERVCANSRLIMTRVYKVSILDPYISLSCINDMNSKRYIIWAIVWLSPWVLCILFNSHISSSHLDISFISPQKKKGNLTYTSRQNFHSIMKISIWGIEIFEYFLWLVSLKMKVQLTNLVWGFIDYKTSIKATLNHIFQEF